MGRSRPAACGVSLAAPLVHWWQVVDRLFRTVTFNFSNVSIDAVQQITSVCVCVLLCWLKHRLFWPHPVQTQLSWSQRKLSRLPNCGNALTGGHAATVTQQPSFFFFYQLQHDNNLVTQIQTCTMCEPRNHQCYSVWFPGRTVQVEGW